MRCLNWLLAGALLGSPAIGLSEGRYQAVPVPGSEDFGGGKVLLLDTQTGYLWTWTEIAASSGSPGGRFLIFQGQLKPGRRVGELIDQQTWSAAQTGRGEPPAPPGQR